jgi:hypothetical protein
LIHSQSFLKWTFHQKNITEITFINSELSQKFGSKPTQQFEYDTLKKGPGHQKKGPRQFNPGTKNH